MRCIRQFGIILLISLAGELLGMVLPLPVPASIYGLVLLFLALQLRLRPLEEVRDAAHIDYDTYYKRLITPDVRQPFTEGLPDEAFHRQKASCAGTAPRKCARTDAGSFCASFPVAPKGRGNGTVLFLPCFCTAEAPGRLAGCFWHPRRDSNSLPRA